MFLTLITSVVESISVAAFFPLFSSLLGDSEEVGGTLGFITDMSTRLPISDPLVAASVLLILVYVVKTCLVLLREGMLAWADARVMYSTKKDVMEKYAGAPYQFFLDSKQGSLLYTLLDATSSASALMHSFIKMMVDFLKVLAIMALLAIAFPTAALAFLVLGLIYYAVVHYISTKVSYRLGIGMARVATEQTVIANEFFSGIRHLITLRAIRPWVDRFDKGSWTYSMLSAKDKMWLAIPRPTMELSAIALMVGFVLILRDLSSGDVADTLPKLGLFAMVIVQILPSVISFSAVRMQMMGQLPRAEMVYQALTESIPRRQEGHRDIETFKKEIKFENLSFAYKGRETLISDMNVTFEKGRVTAIVGSSGAGKTTIISLILGLFEPTSGRITVDGIPLQEIKHDSWLSKIGFVSQDPFTYHASAADNILFGRNGHSKDSLVDATRIANAHGFISELPQGYDTIVGERGMKLSGGQQQRLAIARAVLDSPEILIFDEATSSLDTISEKLVQEAIDKVSSDRTVILIAHRLSTIRYADKIIVLDDGQVVEEGNHQELLSRHGHYSRLVDSPR
jgi:ABC-type multidrug transport system fused ATPase/permease subunit